MGVKERRYEDIWKKANEKRMKMEEQGYRGMLVVPYCAAYQNSLDEWLQNTPFEQHSSLEES